MRWSPPSPLAPAGFRPDPRQLSESQHRQGLSDLSAGGDNTDNQEIAKARCPGLGWAQQPPWQESPWPGICTSQGWPSPVSSTRRLLMVAAHIPELCGSPGWRGRWRVKSYANEDHAGGPLLPRPCPCVPST